MDSIAPSVQSANPCASATRRTSRAVKNPRDFGSRASYASATSSSLGARRLSARAVDDFIAVGRARAVASASLSSSSSRVVVVVAVLAPGTSTASSPRARPRARGPMRRRVTSRARRPARQPSDGDAESVRARCGPGPRVLADAARRPRSSSWTIRARRRDRLETVNPRTRARGRGIVSRRPRDDTTWGNLGARNRRRTSSVERRASVRRDGWSTILGVDVGSRWGRWTGRGTCS